MCQGKNVGKNMAGGGMKSLESKHTPPKRTYPLKINQRLEDDYCESFLFWHIPSFLVGGYGKMLQKSHSQPPGMVLKPCKPMEFQLPTSLNWFLNAPISELSNGSPPSMAPRSRWQSPLQVLRDHPTHLAHLDWLRLGIFLVGG